jgi:CubicO group peptidase (beta-lactamase class C family)
LDGVLAAVKAGQLTEEEITERCRKVLAFKYALGLDKTQPIQMSGLEQRLKRPETQQLLERLEKASVTIVGNEGGILPMEVDLKNTALLTIGPSKESLPFHQQLSQYMKVDRVVAHPDSLTTIGRRLAKYERVIVAIHTEKYASYQVMLNNLASKVPVVCVYFTSLKNMYNKGGNWKKMAGVVLANSGSEAVQTYVADVLVGKQEATGRIPVEVKGYRMPGDKVELKDTKTYRPEDHGMDASVLAKIDEVALEGIRAKAYPGCQVLILKDGMPVYDKCFGTFTYEDSRKVASEDIYDIASLTKTTATLLALMKLYDEGKFGLTDPISKYVPSMKGSRKGRITIEDLLYHQSGLPGSWPFYREAIDDSSYVGGLFKARVDAHHHLQVDRRLFVVDEFAYKKEYVASERSEDYPLQIADGLFVSRDFQKRMLEMIASDKVPLRDRRYRYSCLNFVLLKEMVEQISGMPMDEYLEQEFYAPMGMKHTLYNPLRRYSAEQIVPTVQKDYLRGRKELRGYVHDEIAAFMGGVSGNAGLFSNAHDVAKVYQMLVDGGQYEGKRYLSLETCQFFMGKKSRISRRTLGFDRPDPQLDKGPCANEAPKEVVGHTGFTGTCAWADAKNGLVFVFISNRIYPRPFDHKGLMTLKIRPRIQQLMYQALKE